MSRVPKRHLDQPYLLLLLLLLRLQRIFFSLTLAVLQRRQTAVVDLLVLRLRLVEVLFFIERNA